MEECVGTEWGVSVEKVVIVTDGDWRRECESEAPCHGL